MSAHLLTLVSLLRFVPQASLAQQLQTMPSDGVPGACPITRAPTLPFIPPWPYPLKAGPGEFWFGTDRLWTALQEEGTWRGLPHYTPSDPTFRQKIAFWRKGYVVRTERQPKLTVTGRRLDAPAPPLLADKTANNAWVQHDQPFMGTGINLPTVGCWEITGHYGGEELTFVVWVAE
jgi:hypothetical protein